jgi:hypothetical protein
MPTHTPGRTMSKGALSGSAMGKPGPETRGTGPPAGRLCVDLRVLGGLCGG